MKSMRYMGIVMGTVGMLWLSGFAIAQDRKIYSGNLCQPEFHSRDATKLEAMTNGVRNASATAEIHVTCPIVRDNILNLTGTRGALVRVQSPGGQNLTCTLESREATGGLIVSQSASTISNLPFTLSVDVNASAVLGSYVLHCVLPPQGQIFSYDIDEF